MGGMIIVVDSGAADFETGAANANTVRAEWVSYNKIRCIAPTSVSALDDNADHGGNQVTIFVSNDGVSYHSGQGGADSATPTDAGTGSTSRPSEEAPLEGDLNDLPHMEPLAQFADSYILVQAEDELLLIDQHALHERVRYERLRHSGQAWEPQQRLSPLPLNLDARQSALVDAHHERLHDLGFHLSKEKERWVLNASPQLLGGDQIKPFLLDLLQDLALDGGPLETMEAKKDHIAFMNACRGAVKANESLSLPEMRRLLDDMRRIQNPWACVHGRPTSLRISIDSLDHHFGRHG